MFERSPLPYLPGKGPEARQPLYYRLRDALAQEIVQKRWSKEQAIPSEAELAQTHNVSIGTVRKAIELLVADGLLERQQGKGTFVRRPKFNSSLFRFFRFHQEQDTYRVPTSRILSLDVTGFPAPVAQAMGFAEGAPAIHLSRLRLIDGRPLLLESIWLSKQIFEPLLAIKPEDYGDLLYPLYEKHCGVLVTSAEETLTAEVVPADQAEILELAPGSLVIVIDRLALGYNRERLEWRRSCGPASKFRYRVEIR